METINKLLSNSLYKTEEYEIKRWNFDVQMNPVFGWNDCFCFVLVSSGQYSFCISRHEYKTYTGHVIAEKPNFEYSLCPTSGSCTIINFSQLFYERLSNEPVLQKNAFLSSPQVVSQLLLSNSVVDYLHHKLLREYNRSCRLEMDDTIFELVYEVLNNITDTRLLDSENKHYLNYQLQVVERAKEYIHQNFQQEIGLQEIAENCFASPFHFSRLFRKFTRQSPYQYLLSTRLKHSEILLKTSNLPIAEVAVSSGFSNPDYFATAFKKKYQLMPTDYRKRPVVKRW